MSHKKHSHDSPCGAHESAENNSLNFILTIRSHSGLSGDMLLAGLALLSLERQGLDPAGEGARAWLSEMAGAIMPELAGALRLERTAAHGISGWRAQVDLPHDHVHRNIVDISEIIKAGKMRENAKSRALACFELLAQCEAAAHGLDVAEVHFHEVGALDSILDICMVCGLYEALGPLELVCGPLPVADGSINCAHGILPAPAPAVMRLLRNVPVRPFEGSMEVGELVTPTAIALLLALGAQFGPWPAFRLEREALVYGQRIFDNAANGAIFALGQKF